MTPSERERRIASNAMSVPHYESESERKVRGDAVDVQVSGVIENLGISSWTRRVEIGTIDWTPDMILGNPSVEEMLAWYRDRSAECVQVSFTISLNPAPEAFLAPVRWPYRCEYCHGPSDLPQVCASCGEGG